MAMTKKALKIMKFGHTGTKKNAPVNFWRYIFNGFDKLSGSESIFFIELEMLNPWISPSEVLLGFKPRVNVTEEELQHALAGTKSALEFKSENLVLPSYVAIRIGKLDDNPKQLVSYISFKDLKINNKKFEISVGNKSFTLEQLTGFVNISEDEKLKHPEYFCDDGYATWNVKFDILKEILQGYRNKTDEWIPLGLKSEFTGIVNFDGKDFLIEPKKSFGFIERYWGKKFPQKWFHISSSNLTSNISGKFLANTSFVVQGAFEDRISFIGSFEGTDIIYNVDSGKKLYDDVWNCVQAPVVDEDGNEQLHWTVSINSKNWVIDIDIFCRIKDLYNRNLEQPCGDREYLNVVQCALGIGEIKLFRHVHNSLELIEAAKIQKTFCEFGHMEHSEN